MTEQQAGAVKDLLRRAGVVSIVRHMVGHHTGCPGGQINCDCAPDNLYEVVATEVEPG